MTTSPPPNDPKTIRPASVGIDQLGPAVSAALLETVLARSGTGLVLMDSELRFVVVNDVAAAINGVSVADHLGRRLEEVLPGVAPSIGPALRDVLRTGESSLHLDVSGETPSAPGELRWWSSNAIRLDRPDGNGEPLVAVVFTEVTEQRRAHHRLGQLIDNLFTFVGVLDPAGTVQQANRVALDAGGLQLEEVVGRPFWDASWWNHDPAVQEQLRQAVARAAAGESSRYDVMICLAGDVLVPIDFQLSPIVENDKIVALVPSGLEISARVRESNRLAALASLSGSLNAASDTPSVVAAILGGAEALGDATFVNVALVDSEGRSLRIAMQGIDSELTDRWAVVPLDGISTPLHDAIYGGNIITVGDLDDLRARYPHLVDDTIQVGLEATVSLPLFGDDGDVLGAIGLGWPGAVEVSREAESRFRLVTDLCSQALQRSKRSEVFGELVISLQRELLPPRYTVAGLDVAVDYRPALSEVGFGGDWYDIVADEGRITLVIGDVVGHGVAAAARMAQTKGAVGGLAAAVPLGELIPAVSRAVAADRVDYLATLAVATIDLSTLQLQWVLAGHPPPAVLHPDGSAEFLDTALLPPIGVARTATEPGSRDLVRGSLLVLYTDGLIERRHHNIDHGFDSLLDTLRSLHAGASAQEARDRILEKLIIGDSKDDVAIIVVRIPNDESPAS